MAHQCAMLSSKGKAWRTSAPRFLTHGAKRPWQNLVLPRPLFPCPICAQRRPRITKSSGLCSRAQNIKLKSTPRAASCLLMGKRPTMAAFRRKAAQLQIQLRGKPRIPTGFLLIPLPRSAAAKGRMIRCSSIYIILISYSCTPVNILFRKRGPPPVPSTGGGWVRV